MKKKKFKLSLFYRKFGRLFCIAFIFFSNFFRNIYFFCRQSISLIVIPHVQGGVKNIKISFLTLVLFFVFFLMILFGFILLSINYVTLKSIVKSTEKNYSVVESDIEKFRNTVGDINDLSLNFKKILDDIKFSLKINNNNVDSKTKLDGDFSNFSNFQVIDSNSIKELSDLKNIRSTIESSIVPLKSIVKVLNAQDKLLNDIPSLWPINGGVGIVSLHFGPAVEPFTRQWYIHTGIDLAGVRIGTPIIATADGEVVRASYEATGYGNFVQIKHKYGLATLYAHMSRLNTSKGSYVKKGQIIGFIGQTGYATGPHVHYEVRVGSQVVNPDMYLNLATGGT